MKQISLALLATLAMLASAGAQEQQPTTQQPAQQPAAGLTVRSTPSAAVVALTGDVTVTGVTPTVLQHRLAGAYKVSVKKRLYETYSTTIQLQPGQSSALDVQLDPKTAFKAGLRSLFIPGWGQWYSERKTKGIIFGAAAAASGIGFLIANSDFNQKADDFDAAKARYDLAVANEENPSRLAVLFGQMTAAQTEANDAEDLRNLTVGIAAGVWALNFLDALIFFPDVPTEVTVQGVEISPSASLNSYGLTLVKRF